MADLTDENLTKVLELLRRNRDLAHAAVKEAAAEHSPDLLVAAMWDNIYETHVALVENLLGLRDGTFPLPDFLIDRLPVSDQDEYR